MGKKQTVVLLRWVLIIAFSYLPLVDHPGVVFEPRLALLIVAALASNLCIARIPERWAERRLFDFAVVLFDAGWVTLGLAWAPNVSSDLFMLYFLVIFVAAMGESLRVIVASAVVVSVVYGAMLSFHSGGGGAWSAAAVLRVPFIFVVALFYGYFVSEIRGRRNEASAALLREKAKSDLLAAVSHDLRGPLSNAESLLELALDEGQLVVDRGLVMRAQVNVRRVGSLVTNLLQAACIEAGQVYFQFAPVQLNNVVDDVLGLEAGAAVLKRVRLDRDLAPVLPEITADCMQLGRIITNLVNNAIKYTAPGGRVVVRTAYDHATVRVSVEDTGPGMSAEQCEALFAPYRRVHLAGYTQGTGLGLYIAKHLAEAQSGHISVRSQPGKGSVFILSFPRVAPTAEQAAPVATAHNAPAALRMIGAARVGFGRA